MTKEDIIKFFESMSEEELKEKWEKYNEWSSEKMQSKLLLADVSNSEAVVCGKGNWDCIHEKDGKCKYDGKCTAKKNKVK